MTRKLLFKIPPFSVSFFSNFYEIWGIYNDLSYKGDPDFSTTDQHLSLSLSLSFFLSLSLSLSYYLSTYQSCSYLSIFLSQSDFLYLSRLFISIYLFIYLFTIFCFSFTALSIAIRNILEFDKTHLISLIIFYQSPY